MASMYVCPEEIWQSVLSQVTSWKYIVREHEVREKGGRIVAYSIPAVARAHSCLKEVCPRSLWKEMANHREPRQAAPLVCRVAVFMRKEAGGRQWKRARRARYMNAVTVQRCAANQPVRPFIDRAFPSFFLPSPLRHVMHI